MAELRWLTDREQRAWRRLAEVVFKLPQRLERQLQRDSDMTHFEYWVIAMLSEAPDRTLQLKELAQRSHASLSRLSHVVSRLEARGWVGRERCPTDARATNAVLTEAGWDAVVAAAPGHVAAVREAVFDALSGQDVADLERVCSAILEHLNACEVDGSAGAAGPAPESAGRPA